MSLGAIRVLVVSLIVAIGLTGCGFQLRDNYQLPQTLQHMQLKSVNSQELENSLKQRLLTAGVNLNEPANKQQVAQLQVLSDKLERRTLSLFESGQVAEYELLYRVNYRIIQDNQTVYQDSVEVARDYQDDPNFALAKTREREILVAEMRDDAARRIVRQIITKFSD
ncbi:LPS assembly lipoprotein LptE [Idiomarina seosinensis]|uniref:LPS-assembly lipoprotein LptE n=1 Tax=Idiomarina seosinensis TaxID=281739 RepID=UPI0018E53CA7|nr:LPS assembly lipoprotein LptE [Idiomarina seosinensis]